MGVAIVLGPLLLLFFAAPLLYVVFVSVVVRKAIRHNQDKSARIVGGIGAVLLLSYPVYLGIDFLKFRSHCANPRQPIAVAPFPEVKTIAFVTEGGFPDAPFLWHDEMNLNLGAFEYASIVNGKVVMRNQCDRAANKCTYGGELSSRFMFLVTSPQLNKDGVLQSSVSLVDRQSGTTLYQTSEYIFKGLLASYHGAFIDEPGHRGILSCGYLSDQIDVWRPNGANASRESYARADSRLIATVFPALAPSRP